MLLCELHRLLDIKCRFGECRIEGDLALPTWRVSWTLDVASLIMLRPGLPIFPLYGTGLRRSPGRVCPGRRDFLTGGAIPVTFMTDCCNRPYGY